MGPLESVLLIEVPETEALVGGWREQFDPSAADGVPAHITLLYPMGPPEEMTGEVRRDIGALFARLRPFRFRLERPGRFPGVLFLAPEPDAPFRELIHLIVDLFPGRLPYGGAFDEAVPHLTVAQSEDGALLDRIEAELRPGLPIEARVDSVTLMFEEASGRWTVHERFPLGSGIRS
jgi:2'-5' RNA ligase